jgi:toxin ParE1/3/4
MKVKWSKRALRNADAVSGYLLERNPRAAADVLAAIIQSTVKLSRFPQIGVQLADTDFRVLTVVRFGYVIVYRIRNGEVEILNNHHGRTDWLQDYT